MNFNIKISEGIKFSKESGDFNKIHLNDLEGYNSLFGEKICHGCLVAIKFLKKINYSKLKNFKQIQFSFIKHFLYNKKIVIKKKRNYYLLYQNNEIKAEIAFINKIDSTKYNYSNFSFKKGTVNINVGKSISLENYTYSQLNDLTKEVQGEVERLQGLN